MAWTPLARALSIIVLVAGLCGTSALPVDQKVSGGAAAEIEVCESVGPGDADGRLGRCAHATGGSGVSRLSVQEQSEVWAEPRWGLAHWYRRSTVARRPR